MHVSMSKEIRIVPLKLVTKNCKHSLIKIAFSHCFFSPRRIKVVGFGGLPFTRMAAWSWETCG